MAWVIRQTEVEVKVDIPWNYSASCDVILQWGRDNSCIFSTPEVGDMFLCVNSKNSHDATHIGVVIDVKGNKFRTAEGNSNDEGSREGYEVADNWRENADRFRFVRPLSLVNLTAKPVAVKPIVPPAPKAVAGYTLMLPNGKQIRMKMVQHSNHVPARALLEALGYAVEWNSEKQCVMYDGKEVNVQTFNDGGSKVFPLRKIATFLNYHLQVDDKGKKATLVPPVGR